jgi:hypothetical protein
MALSVPASVSVPVRVCVSVNYFCRLMYDDSEAVTDVLGKEIPFDFFHK